MTIPLPELGPMWTEYWRKTVHAQMLAYGDARAAEERERCAAILLANAEACTGLTREILMANVAAIRNGE